jgi:hypothetical protein
LPNLLSAHTPACFALQAKIEFLENELMADEVERNEKALERLKVGQAGR